MFLWHWTKNVLFSAPLVFLCLGGKVAQYGVEKKSLLHAKGGKALPLRSQSADSLYGRKKKGNNLIGSRCWHCVVIEDGKSSLSRCSYKEVLMALKVTVLGHLPSCGRTAEAASNPKWSQSGISTCKKHQGLNLFVWCNFSPCRVHNTYLSYILRVERQVQIKYFKKILQFQESLKSNHCSTKTLIKMISETLGWYLSLKMQLNTLTQTM